MKKILVGLCVVLVMIVWFSCVSNVEEKIQITTGSVFDEMIDMRGLSEFPDPSYRTIQFSSFDHRSRIPGGPDWFANSDGFGNEPEPNFEQVLKEPDETGVGEYLMAQVYGPGAIVRLWSAAISGKIRLFLDGNSIPIYDGDAIDFFHRFLDLYPQTENFNRDLLERTLYQRDAVYVPIPFAKSMRLVWIGDIKTIHFYQVGVRLYEKETTISTFSASDLETYQESINKVISIMSDPDKNMLFHSEDPLFEFEAELASGEIKEVFVHEGEAALEKLTLLVEADEMDKALRQTLLHIYCDGYPWGQVQSPVGDFFGAAPGVNPYQSLPFTVRADGTMICRYVMPFKEKISIKLENQGEQTVKVKGSAQPISFAWIPDRTMHFRARWRVSHDLVASNRAVQDLAFLIGFGKGVYVGTTSYLLNPNDVPTPYGSWWGEGDEKVFFDGDVVPSIFGTGSEDYYNYSWSSPDIFIYPYCGQPRNDGPGNRGFVTNFRWHILDPLPFEQDIRFFMELYSHEKTPGLSYSRIAYHYACPGMNDDHQAIKPDDLRHLQLPENWQPAMRMGAKNSTMHHTEAIISSRRNTQLRDGRRWADGKLLVWTPRTMGETISLPFRIEESGKYRVNFVACLNPESGKISMQIDEKPVPLNNKTEIVDLFRPFRTLLRNFALPVREFESGRHTLTFRFEGANEAAAGPIIGVDFIWIQKLDR